jgi:hypothetical protein
MNKVLLLNVYLYFPSYFDRHLLLGILILGMIFSFFFFFFTGMLREAYEVDPLADGIADGLVEVCEGWGFAAAVLPRIAYCNATAGQIINDNMNTVPFITTTPADKKGVYMKDGFHAVVDAVEGTFECLGITCQQVKSMVLKGTSNPLWQSCRLESNKGSNGKCTVTREEYERWRQIGIGFIVVSVVLATLLSFKLLCPLSTKKRNRHNSGSDLCAAPRAETNNPDLHNSLVDNKSGGLTPLEVTVKN